MTAVSSRPGIQISKYGFTIPPGFEEWEDFFRDVYRDPSLLALQFFGDYFYQPFARFQKNVIHRFTHSMKQVIVALISRGFGKSKIVSFLLALFAGMFFGYEYILLVGGVKEQGEQRLADIANGVFYGEESTDFKVLFGDVRGRNFSERHLHILSEAWGFNFHIEAYGLYGPLRGKSIGANRMQLVVIDDPENEEDSKNPDRVANKIERFFHSIVPGLAEKDRFGRRGQVWWLGTPMPYDCVVSQVIERWPDLELVKYPCLDENDRSIWATMFSTKSLWEKRDNLIKANLAPVWWSEYMLDSQRGSIMSFDEPYQYFAMEDIRNIRFPLKMAIDASYSTKRRADPTGIAVAGFDSNRRFFVMHSEEGKFKPKDFAKKVAEIFIIFKNMHRPIDVIAIEATAYEFVRETLANELPNYGISMSEFRMFSLDHNKYKIDRITAELIPLHVDGRMYLMQTQNRLLAQMRNFPALSRGSGSIDALAHAAKICYVPIADREEKEKVDRLSIKAIVDRNLREEKMKRDVREIVKRRRNFQRRIEMSFLRQRGRR